MEWDIDVKEKVYQRLANEIFFRILHGEYALSTKLPSYTNIAKEAGSSPETARKAVQKLQYCGVVEKTRQGYFVVSDMTPILTFRQQYLEAVEHDYLEAKEKVKLSN